MPTTFRKAVHDGKKGLSACISYIKNPVKTGNGKFVTAINCTKAFAVEEFYMIHEKYTEYISEADRMCYHAWQSFDYRDDITPEKVHEIGIKVCKELYPDYQCIVCTHLDKGHYHNHIIINARNLNGRKLVDRLADPVEGLYGLREVSDRLAVEYGCSVIQDAPKIGLHKSRNYKYAVSESARKTLISLIDKLKESCNDFDELLENLSFEGYIIKGGKHISVLPPGRKKVIRFKTLGDEYSEESLKTFFYEKKKSSFSFQYEEKLVCMKKSEIIDNCIDAAKNIEVAIKKSEKGLKQNCDFPKYFNSRYMEMKRYKELVKSIDYLNKENIYSYDDLVQKATDLHAEIELLELQYKKAKSSNNTLQSKLEDAKVFVENYWHYCNYEEEKEMFESMKEPDEVKDFLHAKDQLGNPTIQEAREIIAQCNQEKQSLIKQYAYLSYLKNKASELDKLRMRSLDSNPQYIKSIAISSNMIDEEKATNTQAYVRIPYTNQYVYLNKESILWSNYGKKGFAYLIDDDTYALYDKEGNVVDSVEGVELQEISLNAKKDIIAKKSKDMSVTDMSNSVDKT